MSWTRPRLLGGRRIPATVMRIGLYTAAASCVLAAGFVMIGSTRADSSTVHQVAVAARDLPVGLVPGPHDIRFVTVRTDGSLPGRWLMRSSVGTRALTSAVPRDAVLLASDFQPSGRPGPVIVSLPAERGHVPVNLRRGDVVDLWFTPRDAALITGGADAQVSRRAIGGVTVCAVHPGEMTGDVIVEVCAPASGVGAIVQATRAGSIDVVRSQPGAGDV